MSLMSSWAVDRLAEPGIKNARILIVYQIALLLGVKREAIGATFSVDREPSLAIIGEKYGMHSPEGRGVLAEYINCTIFGAVFIALLVGYGLHLLARSKIPAVVCVPLLGIALTYPNFPMAAAVAGLTGKINFLALATPILAFAGLAIAKDVPAFRCLAWRIVVTSFASNAGTFIGATIIAQFFFLH